MSRQNTAFTTAARKTEEMIGRESAIDDLKQAINPGDDSLQVAFIRASGGMGKSRLLETVRQMQGKTDNTIFITEIVDVIDTRLHARTAFLRALRNSLLIDLDEDGIIDNESIILERFDKAYDDLRSKVAHGLEFQHIRSANEAVAEAFMEDIKEHTKSIRIVWLLDTVEVLSFATSEWLLERNLLESTDLEGRTHHWLTDIIQKAGLRNVTFVLAGRGEEGAPFFDAIEKAVQSGKEKNNLLNLRSIELDAFNQEETRLYFQHLAKDWRKRANGAPQYTKIADNFAFVAEPNRDNYKVVWLYTGGIPVRLALYAQIIAENKTIPEELKFTFAKVCIEAKTSDPKNSTIELEKIQWAIEEKFIDLIFTQPNNEKAQILQALVRAPRGLSVAQLHFIIKTPTYETKLWRPNPTELEALEKTIKEMKDLYLVRGRASWPEYAELERDKPEAFSERIGLQDEIYRIYAEHMAPHIEPISDIAKQLDSWLDKEKYEQNYRDECNKRRHLYERLVKWAKHYKKKYLEIKQNAMREEEEELEKTLQPHLATTFQFQDISEEDVASRAERENIIHLLEIEEMTYALRQNIEKNFNIQYIDLAYKKHISNNEDLDFRIQTEMWRVIFDVPALKFSKWDEREAVTNRKESLIAVLQRAARQEDINRWLKRFVLRARYERAEKFFIAIEKAIRSLPYTQDPEKIKWRSWNHTLAQAERRIWANYAQILATDNIQEAIQALKEELQKLKLLANAHGGEQAVMRNGGEYWEMGFKANDEKEEGKEHPAYNRLQRIISYGENVLGYGNVTIGNQKEAVKNYNSALQYARERKAEAHLAVVLNNLSRALSDKGRRADRVCKDAISLRQKQAEPVPLAFSYNTLALIYNDSHKPDEAWRWAAKAVAYFRRTGEPRGLGLALIELARALRYLAAPGRDEDHTIAYRNKLYTTAHYLLIKADKIFEPLDEPIRRIEIANEYVGLYRDRARMPEDSRHNRNQKTKSYREGRVHHQRAIKWAKGKKLPRHEVMLNVNFAWLQFFTGNSALAEKTIEKIEADPILNGSQISTTFAPDPEEMEYRSLLVQLSKIQSLKAQIALLQFEERKEHFSEEKYPDPNLRHQEIVNDLAIQEAMKKAVEAFILGIGYAELYSPRAYVITLIYDQIYDVLKKFNHKEQVLFQTLTNAFMEDYEQPMKDIRRNVFGMVNLKPLFEEYIGLLPTEGNY